MLDLQDDIVCAGELFNKGKIPFRLRRSIRHSDVKKHINRTIEWRDAHPLEFLRRFWSFDSNGSCLGFKLILVQNPTVEENVLSDRSIKKIIVSRRNKIKRHVSLTVAQQTNSWTKYEDTATEQIKVNIDPEHLLQHERANERRIEDIRQRLISSNQPFKEVYYEDLVGEQKIETLTSVAEFLGCRNIEPTCWSKDAIFKQNSDRLADIVENYDELKKALAGTELEPFLDQGV
jgi:Stf0 sulphotransferase.